MEITIVDFLIKAKRATYAGHGIETTSSRPNSYDFQYAEGSLKYIDSYLGGDKFAGEEALWKDNIPFWAMNYAGRVIGENFSGDFLKEALSLVPEDKPFRDPAEYTNGDYTYKCKVDGNFHWFSGYEEILLQGEKIYELFFHGGEIDAVEL